tara:strand:- start:185 stop:481 length:297 start_codon:yes stop_codon:yes gene_type:complete
MKINSQQPPEFQGVKGGNAKENQKNTELLSNTLGSAEPSTKASNFVMNKIKSQISTEPEIREEQVAELKAKIKSGEFSVDSQNLAKTMIEDALKEDIA